VSTLILKTLTCHSTVAPIGGEPVTLKFWKLGEPNIVHIVDADALAAGEVHSFEGQIDSFEFDKGVHLELFGPSGSLGGIDVGAGVDLELTAELSAQGARYTLRYVVVTTNKSAVMLEVGESKNGVTKTAREDCHIGDGLVSCPRANLIVEVDTPAGERLAGATVYLELQNRGRNGRRRLATGVSDANGLVNFGGIDPGDYFVVGTKKRHTPAEATEAVEIAPAENARVTLELQPPYLYFALYYLNDKTDADRAFRRAAETWQRQLLARPSFRKNIDDVTLEWFTTKAQFRNAWESIRRYSASMGDALIMEGHIFSHGTPKGIEFPDGTLTKAEVPTLSVLNWERDGGELELLACRAGSDGQFSTAAAFAQHQRVKTTGFDEWGLFSTSKDEYHTINSGSKDVYLKDYQKPQSSNCWFWCDGKPNDAQVYFPPAENKCP
jgi:hypothetical protein